MKIRAASWLFLLSFALLVEVPSFAQNDLYDNGPINGTDTAWGIGMGLSVGDSFTISSPSGSATMNGLSFGAWLAPGDTLESAEVSVTSQPLGGTTYFDEGVNFTGSNCSVNTLNYQVCQETGSFDGPTLNNGVYWLNLQNAVTTEGNLVWWDENDGVGCNSPGCPSQAVDSASGTIPSESFSVLGTNSPTGTTPEPGSILLFGTGAVGVLSVVRRKLL